jgi:hypothetical protein
MQPINTGWELSHLFSNCEHPLVKNLRRLQLEAHSDFLRQKLFIDLIDEEDGYEQMLANNVGREMQTEMPPTMVVHFRVLSIYLLGGWIRLVGGDDGALWFHDYTVGFGHSRLQVPELETFGYVPVAQFLQRVSPLYLDALGGDLYGVRSLDGSHVASSRDSSVNPDHMWLEGYDPHLADERSSPGDGDPFAP